MSNQYEKELHLHGAGDSFLLENKLKEMFNKKYCLLTCSATGAIETIIGSLELTEKKILTSPFQWPGMLVPFMTNRNRIYFSQVNQSLSIQLEKDSFITPHLVFAVDYFGIAHASQENISTYCNKNGSIYVTDASSSMGTITETGHPTGYLSDFVITSFGPQKPFYGGEGGAILTDSESYFEKMVLFTGHPYRQLAEGLSVNFLAHNLRMNPFGIHHLLEYFNDYLLELKNKQTLHYHLYQQLLNDKFITDKGPVYKPGNSTFSPLVVNIKTKKLLPAGLKISRPQIKPAFLEGIPSFLKNSARLIFNKRDTYNDQIQELICVENA